jgi:hypothetical protein
LRDEFGFTGRIGHESVIQYRYTGKVGSHRGYVSYMVQSVTKMDGVQLIITPVPKCCQRITQPGRSYIDPESVIPLGR